MRSVPLACFVVAAMCLCPLANDLRGADKDNVVGAIWHYTLTHGKKEKKGYLRVFKDEIFHGADKIGVVKPKGPTDTELTFTNKEPGGLNGKAVLTKTKKSDPATWKGDFESADGGKWEMVVQVKNK